jgi:hypothetical protein
MHTIGDQLPGLVAQLVDPVRLLLDHADDGTGHCRLCASHDSAGRARFPCRLHDIATTARRAA